MNFAAPQMLWLLAIAVPGLTAFFWWAWRKRQQLITQFISARLLAVLKVGVSATRQKARMAMLVAVVALLIVAMARPQWGFIQEEARQRGLDILVAVDTSNSMLAQDVPPDRLTRAKLAALDLAQRARTDRVGLIAFAGSAFLECPLTLDDAAFAASVNSLDTRTIADGGTAIADAIGEARRAFKKESGNHRVLVLFTDGEDQDSDAIVEAKSAADEGVIVLTVGVGTAEGDVLRIRNERGGMDYIRDENEQPVKSHLNEELLQQIAAAGKGFYLPLRGNKTMDTLYDQGIAPLPKSEFSARYFQHLRERFQWPLGLAMLLLIVETFLPDRKRRRSRTRAATPPPIPAMVKAATLLALLMLPMMARAGSPSTALREYNDGDFANALKDYNNILEKKTEDPRLHFNAGAAAYQDHKMDEAVKQFEAAATNTPDLNLQQHAYYNEGNALFRLGQQVSDPTKKQEDWENALQVYSNALALNHQDTDAAYNHQFVQKQLEELKKQQSQQSQNNGNQQQKDQKQDQKNQNQNGSKNDQQQNSSSQQNQNQDKQQDRSKQKSEQNSEKPQSQQAGNQSDQDKQKQQEKQDQDKKNQDDQKDKHQAQKNQGSGEQPKDQSAEEARQEAAAMAAGEMSPQQAQKLLDAQKDDEQVLRLAPPNNNTSEHRTLKNW